MEVRTYLERIGHDKPVRPDEESLYGLHRAHLFNVPFENLDIHAGLPILLFEQSLWDKIIVRKRGGFCYELNGMFAWLLKQIGFEVRYLNARVYNQSNGKRGREFDHLTLLVKGPGEEQGWLADVGFGDSFLEPLRLENSIEQVQGVRAFRIEAVANGYDLWKRNIEGEWKRQYFFDLQPRNFPSDYEEGCLYHRTSPHSSFTHERLISMATPDGRITLDSNYLTITTQGKRLKRELRNENEFQELLNKQFGMR